MAKRRRASKHRVSAATRRKISRALKGNKNAKGKHRKSRR